MSRSNSATRYGSVAKTFHWLTALLIATAIPLGLMANGAPFETGEELARKAWLFSLHKTVGVTVFFVALARIVWALRQQKPVPLHPDRRAETLVAEVVHWLLYGSLVLVPLSGWVHHASTTGFAPIWWPFGQGLPFVPKSESLAAASAGLHIVFERVLIVSVLLHVAGAMKHVIIDRDDTLRRMWFGKTHAGAAQAAHPAWIVPVIPALGVWALAIAIGSWLGLYAPHHHAQEGADLEQVASEWSVDRGDISITITQFGSDVTGSFSDWTSQISFDPDEAPGVQGHVTTTVRISSLTLGSVTDQAMGPDFFAVESHPTAVFDAQIVKLVESYEARGTLGIKGSEAAITLPFTLDMDGDTATMRGQIELDRLTFGIGANLPDESSLSFPVLVKITLTATRR